jgi:hypothetical protein
MWLHPHVFKFDARVNQLRDDGFQGRVGCLQRADVRFSTCCCTLPRSLCHSFGAPSSTHNLNQYLNVDTNKLYFSQLDSVLTPRVLISGVPPSGQTSHFESLKRISSV